ncbi:hypothetical protein SDC9_173259 [bioreactor metagenome]|uniref:Uncharacterized protein n=1 Tax=bioreactor metagenome TaxID=1076179 RepID=A0A645GQ97_9ZZZZ
MRATHRPRTYVQRRTDDATGRKTFEQHERPKDVHETVDRPHLMKVDLLGRHSVNAPFRRGQPPKRSSAALLHERRKTASLDDIENVVQMPVRMMLMRRNFDPVAGHAAARDAQDADIHIRNVQRRRNGSRKRRRKLLRSFKPIYQVEHRPKRHISGDPRETVEIQNAHRYLLQYSGQLPKSDSYYTGSVRRDPSALHSRSSPCYSLNDRTGEVEKTHERTT